MANADEVRRQQDAATGQEQLLGEGTEKANERTATTIKNRFRRKSILKSQPGGEGGNKSPRRISFHETTKGLDGLVLPGSPKPRPPAGVLADDDAGRAAAANGATTTSSGLPDGGEDAAASSRARVRKLDSVLVQPNKPADPMTAMRERMKHEAMQRMGAADPPSAESPRPSAAAAAAGGPNMIDGMAHQQQQEAEQDRVLRVRFTEQSEEFELGQGGELSWEAVDGKLGVAAAVYQGRKIVPTLEPADGDGVWTVEEETAPPNCIELTPPRGGSGGDDAGQQSRGSFRGLEAGKEYILLVAEDEEDEAAASGTTKKTATTTRTAMTTNMSSSGGGAKGEAPPRALVVSGDVLGDEQ